MWLTKPQPWGTLPRDDRGGPALARPPDWSARSSLTYPAACPLGRAAVVLMGALPHAPCPSRNFFQKSLKRLKNLASRPGFLFSFTFYLITFNFINFSLIFFYNHRLGYPDEKKIYNQRRPAVTHKRERNSGNREKS